MHLFSYILYPIWICDGVPKQGKQSSWEDVRAKRIDLNCKLNDKNIKELENGKVDTDLGVATPGSLCATGDGTGVKAEMPNFGKVKEMLKTSKKSCLI